MSCDVCNYQDVVLGEFLGTEVTGEAVLPKIHPLFSRRKKMIDQGCPFVCPSCYRFLFKMRAIRDIVFVWPIPVPEKYEPDGEIVRPNSVRDVRDEIHGRTDYGILLSFGPGFYNFVKKRFFSTGNQLYAGAKVLYDRLVPYEVMATGYDGKEYLVVMAGYQDIKGVCLDE